MPPHPTEYLIKQHLQTTEQVYLSLWQEALAGIQKHLLTATKHSNLRFIAELPTGIGGPLNPKMDHLTCFLPGAIALGATGGLALSEARRQGQNFPGGGWTASQENQIYLARELLKTCWAMNAVTATGLAPEIAYFNAAEEDLQPGPGGGRSPHSKRRSSEAHVLWKKDIRIKPADAHNLQRPETVESLFVLWRITGDPVYQERGWKIFEAFERHTRLGGGGEGYTSIDNVNAVPSTLRDNMESFWLVSEKVCKVMITQTLTNREFGLCRPRRSNTFTSSSRRPTLSPCIRLYSTRRPIYFPGLPKQGGRLDESHRPCKRYWVVSSDGSL